MKNLAPKLRRSLLLQVLIIVFLTPGLVLMPVQVGANPSGGQVVVGDVNFQGLGTAILDINNLSQKAIINWQSFSIDAGEVTRINQGAGAFTLNRVISGNPSAIYGRLEAANGGVAVINTNGILVGAGGVVDVGGMMLMSTLDVSNEDFLGGGSNRFKGSSSAGIGNYGSITSQNGDVVLLANFLQNPGSVSASRGTVAFGAGGDILVDQGPGGTTISVQSGGSGGEVGIDNSGTVDAAVAELKAHGNVYALAIKNDGLVRASGYNFRGGKLTLSAGSSGSIVNTGTLQARNSDGSGGRVEISGGQVDIGSGLVDASGVQSASGSRLRAGGSVDISGSEVSVGRDATVSVAGSSGGSVSITGSTSTAVSGRVEATGDHGVGGRVAVTAPDLTVGSTAVVDASGLLKGGSILVGGGFGGNDPSIVNAQDTVVEAGALLISDAEAGDGGEVAVWSDGGTLFAGEISAQARGFIGNGGFVEVSGRESLQVGGSVNTAAFNGKNGTFLIDPTDVTIYSSTLAGAVGTMTDEFLVNALKTNNVIIHTGASGNGIGNISVLHRAKVIYDSPNSLTMLANQDIYINGDIKNIGSLDTGNTGHITLVAGWDGTLSGALGDNVSASDFINPDGTALTTPGRFGAWGALGSGVYLNEQGSEAVEVGSARGQTNVFADVVRLRHGTAEGRFAQIGYRRVADTRAVSTHVDNIGATDYRQFSAYFADPTTQIVDGAINVTGLSSVSLLPSDQYNQEQADKTQWRGYTMIGHGGIRRGDDSIDNVGGSAILLGRGYDSGVIAVDDGSNSGDITVYAGNTLRMKGSGLQAHTQIGHGGHGGGGPNSGNIRLAGGGLPQLGTIIFGNMSGDINITAGSVDMEAGLYSDTPVQIGHGGLNVRGEHSGDISVKSTTGGIRGTAAPNLGDAGPTNSSTDWRWTNNRDNSYVMIGHGGTGSFYQGYKTTDIQDLLPQRTVLMTTSAGADQSIGGSSVSGDGIRINPATGLPFGHSGNIEVDSAGGVHFTATGNAAFAMIGHGGTTSRGDHRGDVTVTARNGNVIFDRIAIQLDRNGMDRRNVGEGAFVQIGHGGRRTIGGHTGDINVTATGNVEMYAGRNEAYAMIGHGGRGEDSTIWSGGRQRGAGIANGTHSGDISVIAGGDVKFRSGFGTGSLAFSKLGHGGHLQLADVLNTGQGGTNLNPDTGLAELVGGGATRILVDGNGDPILDINGKYQLVADATQQGHNGDIFVTAGGDIDFRAGQTEAMRGQEPFGMEMNRNYNSTTIGHGGDTSWGDHGGLITLDAGGDVVMEARGGWDAVSFEGNDLGAYDMTTSNANARGVPRLASDEDNATTGIRNYAQIGHGGFDSNHRNTDTNSSWNRSGKNGEGMGTWGPSDISITAGGDIISRAAMMNSVGPELLDRAILGRNGVTNAIEYYDQFGNIVQLSATVGAHNARPHIVNRAAPDAALTGDLTGVRGEVIGRTTFNEITEFRSSTFSGDGNQNNRFRMNLGTGFAGGEIVYLSGAAIGTTLTPGGHVLSATQAYEVFDARGDNNDFRLRPIDFGPNGGVRGATLVITTPPAVGTLQIAAQTWNGWKMPEPVMGAQDSYAQIGNGGRSTNFTNGFTPGVGGLADGLGHRGNITLNAGGSVVAMASDIEVGVGYKQGVGIQRIKFDGSQRERFAIGGDGLLTANREAVPDIFVGPVRTQNHDLNGTMRPFIEQIIATNGVEGDPRGQQNFSLTGRNYVMIGNGGWTSRGDHAGDITITAGTDANGNGLILHAGEGTFDFAQIGNGGWDSDGWDPLGSWNNDNNRLNDKGSTSEITINVGGDILVQGGGVNGNIQGSPGSFMLNVASLGGGQPNETTVITRDEGSLSYAQIGSGGYANGGSHGGDIFVRSHLGSIDLLAGNNARFNSAQIGNGGTNARGQSSGDITVVAQGGFNAIAQAPFRDFEASHAQMVNPVHSFGLDNTGHISVGVGNSVMVGNGGWDADPQGGNLNLQPGIVGHTGNIEVVAVTGSILLKGGGNADSTSISVGDDSTNRGNSAQIGNGGNFTDGDHGGNIRVVAGENLTLAGAAGSRDSFTQIGHGGLNGGTSATESGTFTGDIEVVVGNDLIMNRGSNTDAGTSGQGRWVIRQTAGTVQQQVRWSNTLENTLPFAVSGASGTNLFNSGVNPHGLVNGDRVVFPAAVGGLLANTAYYVIDATATTFRIEATIGGGPVVTGNFTNGNMQRQFAAIGWEAGDVIGTGQAHGLQMGDRVQFANITGGSGLTASTVYFIRDVTPTSFKVSAAFGGAAINFTTDITAAELRRAETFQGFRTARDGNEVFNNYTKIGHGDHSYRQRGGGSESALRNGDITISVGNDMNLADRANRPYTDGAYAINPNNLNFADQVLIGHIDSRLAPQNPFRSTAGNTYIAVGRDNPYSDGTGRLLTNGSKVMISSAGEGTLGELRIYMPGEQSDMMGPNLFLNSINYERGGFTVEATEHLFTTGVYGELVGNFTPEGIPINAFAGYGLFYGAVNPNRGGGGGGGGYTPTKADLRALFDEKLSLYEAFERDDEADFEREDEAASAYLYSLGGESFTEEDEEDSELRKEVEELVGGGRISFQFYDPGMNRYSSFRLFGTPAAVQGSIPSLPGDTPVTVTP
jgi:filamentous hemagglutinin family protein